MNPLVKVVAKTADIAAESDRSFLREYNVVVLLDASLSMIREIDAACREAGVKFFGGQSRGTAGFFFVDLLEHSFTPTVRCSSCWVTCWAGRFRGHGPACCEVQHRAHRQQGIAPWSLLIKHGFPLHLPW